MTYTHSFSVDPNNLPATMPKHWKKWIKLGARQAKAASVKPLICNCPPPWAFGFIASGGGHQTKTGFGHHVSCPMYVERP